MTKTHEMIKSKIVSHTRGFKWLPNISFVCLCRLSHRQIKDTVNWIFSEQMMLYYIHIFRDSFWPDGKLAPYKNARSEAERHETKEKAQQKLLDNIPGNFFFLNKPKDGATVGSLWPPLPVASVQFLSSNVSVSDCSSMAVRGFQGQAVEFRKVRDSQTVSFNSAFVIVLPLLFLEHC